MKTLNRDKPGTTKPEAVRRTQGRGISPGMNMSISLKYINAGPDDSQLLTDTAMASKRHWGYSHELMNLWQTDLEVSREYILAHKVVKVYHHDNFIGFYGLVKGDSGLFEIDHLWIVSSEIKKGYGEQIFGHIKNYLRGQGERTVQLTADPNANGFYDKMGGQVIGQVQSKVSGRMLDIYQYSL